MMRGQLIELQNGGRGHSLFWHFRVGEIGIGGFDVLLVIGDGVAGTAEGEDPVGGDEVIFHKAEVDRVAGVLVQGGIGDQAGFDGIQVDVAGGN